ncbi:MAG: TetR/AcrR family transcriptional regulator [Solirubrobacteraceae bacterium]
MSSRTDRAPRRRLDVDQRREAILAAARSLYAKAPYPEVSIAQIAWAAGASPALVFHYFGSKASLYAAVVDAAVQTLADAQRTANAHFDQGASARDRVRASLLVYLDHIATHPITWAAPLLGGEEPREAVDVRHRARAGYVAALRDLLKPPTWARHDYALWGYFGFLDQACLHWVQTGCPDTDRHALIDAALGALEGALGDWGS